MSKILKKRINIKRKESINKGLLIQVIFSIVLVIAVIATKQFGNNSTGVYLNNAKEKLSETINFKEIFSNVKTTFQNLGDDFSLSFFKNDEYAAPVSGKIYKKYGLDSTAKNTEYNHGIDIISNIETVKAVSSGNVTLVGSNEKLSNYIIIENDGKKFIYAKLEEVFVEKGDVIEVGEIIGKLNDESKLLHLEIWENGESINPSKLFNLNE